jgi:hypothetical protein
MHVSIVTTQFELYTVYAFSTEIGNKTYARFHLGNAYFAVNVPQRTHLALSQNELLRCRGHHELKICPAGRPEFSHEPKTCLLSLYLQLETVHEICPRDLSTTSVYVTTPADAAQTRIDDTGPPGRGPPGFFQM